MDFIVELIRSSFKYVFMICVAVCGVLIGKIVRQKKDAKKNVEKLSENE